MDINYLSPSAALQQKEQGALFIHTLPAEHYAAQHIPGAENCCVYLVSFIGDVTTITEDRQRPIVLYGTDGSSREAEVAADKLTREGFEQVFVLEGGLAAWQTEGLPLAGSMIEQPLDPGIMINILDGQYRVDIAASQIGWAGRNQNSKHVGGVGLRHGMLKIAGGGITGELVVSMDTIANRNLAGDPLQTVLEDHLKSDDFFFVRQFPAATLTIKSGRINPEPYLTATNCTIAGTLELKGVTRDIEFEATVYPREEGQLGLEAHFDLDRTRWGVIYGSTRFFKHLGMHTVFDRVSIELRLICAREDAAEVS